MTSPRQLHIRDVDLFGAAVVMAVLVGGYCWAIHDPLRVAFRRAEAKRNLADASQELRRETDALTNRLANVRRLEEHLASCGGDLADSACLDRYLSMLTRLTRDCGIRLAKVLPAGKVPRGEYEESRLTIQAWGSFPEFYRCLSAIEKSNRPLSVSHFTIKADGSPNSVLTLGRDSQGLPPRCRLDWTTKMYFANPLSSDSLAADGSG